MNTNESVQVGSWPVWQKWAFRFFCIYFLLMIEPWTWLNDVIPGLSYVTELINKCFGWLVVLFNSWWFHFKETPMVNNGSGDTSYSWKLMYGNLSIAVIGSIIWGLIDQKRNNYLVAAYTLRTIIRYALIMICFIYGVDKLYATQMPFPNQSQLATPLGDFLPMRFSWMFIGYSTPYEVFSGTMEVLAGILLLNRRTITLGLFIALAVFTNVMVLNLCYDIPVKQFSIHLVIYCLYLLSNDYKRLIDFFVFNKAVMGNTINQFSFPKKWMHITRVVLKIIFIGLFVVTPFFTTRNFYLSMNQPGKIIPIKPGIYDVATFTINNDTLPALVSDTLRWRDMIFEKDGGGSVGSKDSSFRQRYGRGYFNAVIDSAKQTLVLKKSTNTILSLHYHFPDSNSIQLRGIRNHDSIYVLLKKSNRHFQLAEKQFHWISEANR